MLRPVCASLLIALAHTASAATLSVGTDKLTYAVGETVTVTVVGDDGVFEGTDIGARSYGIFGRLDYNGALVDNGTRSQVRLIGEETGNWIVGSLAAADANAPGAGSYSDAFNQIAFPSGDTALNLPGTLATVTLIAASTGVVDLNWHTADVNVFSLTFFGLTNAPGASFTIVPEPVPGALLALGLLGLARWRRVLSA